MYIYIFEYVGQLTDSYHSGGGLVVVASSKEHVKELVAERNKEYRNDYCEDEEDDDYCKDYLVLTQNEWDIVVTYPIPSDAKAELFIFPDAGCC